MNVKETQKTHEFKSFQQKQQLLQDIDNDQFVIPADDNQGINLDDTNLNDLPTPINDDNTFK